MMIPDSGLLFWATLYTANSVARELIPFMVLWVGEG